MVENAMVADSGVAPLQPKWQDLRWNFEKDCRKAWLCPCISMYENYAMLGQGGQGILFVIAVGVAMILRYVLTVAFFFSDYFAAQWIRFIFAMVVWNERVAQEFWVDYELYRFQDIRPYYILAWIPMTVSMYMRRRIFAKENKILRTNGTNGTNSACMDIICMQFCHCFSILQEKRTINEMLRKNIPVGETIAVEQNPTTQEQNAATDIIIGVTVQK